MGTPQRPDPKKDQAAKADPNEPAPSEFVERPRAKPNIYISRPELGRDPADRGDRER